MERKKNMKQAHYILETIHLFKKKDRVSFYGTRTEARAKSRKIDSPDGNRLKRQTTCVHFVHYEEIL